MKRESGVLLPITSLWGDYGIGGIGTPAKEWIDFLKDSGFTWWQMLPLCVPDYPSNSPYKSPSAFACNPNLIDLEDLSRRGLLTEAELEAAKQASPYGCEFARLHRERFPLLRLAASRADSDLRDKIASWCDGEPEVAAACDFLGATEDERYVWRFTQYLFDEQWRDLRAYAREKGVKLLGDIPFYVAPDSADVANHPEQFQLTKDGRLSAVAGVPPDYFSPKGQLWGNPLYNWKAMKADGYAWWKARVRRMLSLFDGLRIDHFRAVESYWSLPADAEDATAGRWVKGPGMDFVKAVKEEAGDNLLIAEDLGDITPAVEKLVEKSGFPGMRVFQFGFDTPHSPHRIHNYPAHCVCYTGTHDNNTLLGFLFELDEGTRRQVLAYVGADGIDDGCEKIVSAMLMSHGNLCILPLQDLLRYGRDTRVNVPGEAEGNWGYRVTKEQVQTLSTVWWKEQNTRYGRC